MDLRKIVFLDIETVPQYASFADVPEPFKKLWETKAAQISKSETDTAEILYPRAGIYAEFGKVVCISCAYFNKHDKEELRVKSFFGHDEKQLLQEFAGVLNRHFPLIDKYLLCAHNGKEFDFPFLGRRMIINGVDIPAHLNHSGKKPWEIPHLDTMELWKFGDYKSYTSLELLTAILGIPNPKDDIKGSDVWRVYWQENDLERIATYCAKDTVSLAQILRKFSNLDLVPEEKIIFA
jgi:3'-5' exonuclease